MEPFLMALVAELVQLVLMAEEKLDWPAVVVGPVGGGVVGGGVGPLSPYLRAQLV